MAFPLGDGKGPRPDSWAEALGYVALFGVVVFLFSFFTGLDAQVSYLFGSPGQYFSVSSDSDNAVYLTGDQIGDINFASKNRIGFSSSGDEIGMCAGVRNNGDVYDLRLAEGFKETSRTSVTFSCIEPRALTLHSQPEYSGDLSVEDKSFDGEFQPEYTCIVFGELAVSPVSGEVGGINCWSVDEGGEFSNVPVLQG